MFYVFFRAILVAESHAPRHNIAELKQLIRQNDDNKTTSDGKYELALADIYFYSIYGTPIDIETAVDWYMAAMEKGNAQAEIWVAMYLNTLLIGEFNLDILPPIGTSRCSLTFEMRNHELYRRMVALIGNTFARGHISPFGLTFVEQSIQLCNLTEQLPLPPNKRIPGATACLYIAVKHHMLRLREVEDTRARVLVIRNEKKSNEVQKRKMKNQKKKARKNRSKLRKRQQQDEKEDGKDENIDLDNEDDQAHNDPQNPFSLLSLRNSLSYTDSNSSFPSVTPTTAPTSSWSAGLSPETCVICLDVSLHHDHLFSVCHPTHLFHHLCLNEWIKTCQQRQLDTTCPICRVSINLPKSM